jgi:hypothetical protein
MNSAETTLLRNPLSINGDSERIGCESVYIVEL